MGDRRVPRRAGVTRRPLFWALFAALGVGGAATALQLFTVALPNVSLAIEMDREAAIAGADSLALRNGWGPDPSRSAASFGQIDPEVQTYVELEGGGRGAFQELMDAGAYQPYQWRVRRFAEGEVEEVEVRFTPAGAPYGFRRRLAEDDPGSGNLPEAEARAEAEAQVGAWGVELDRYGLIEASEEVQPSGRVDLTFVYERSDLTLADARFRLRLVVAGDRLSELTHFVFVPEAFSRRYADMRSTNDTIALTAQAVLILLYVLLGAGVGTALLLRGRWIEWRAPVGWAALTALLFGLNTINALPLSWMTYDTAVSAGTFVFQNVAAAGAFVLLGTPLLAFFFLAGESLGRRAFPEHLQQWRFWSPEVAASKTALGMTVAAYLLVGLQLGYVVLFYLGTSRLEGWWSPADALVQPDLLATYFPWLQAVSLSLFASLWEESIFRAVPIACAALIGARFGRRNLWIWGAVLFQALIFAAGHANYPQQPPYARVVELTLPALAWGAVYVAFGLVPTILAHFLYDLALISSLLFASGALVDQGVIILVAAVPLAVVLRARRSRRPTDRPPEWAYNRMWSPPPSPARAPEEGRAAPRLALPRMAIPALGAVGLALWVLTLRPSGEGERLEISRGQAIAIAEEELRGRGHDLEGWAAGASTGGGASPAHEYVFREAGAAEYRGLAGLFLAPPQWIVRFVDWDAESAERVEEFVVNIGGDGSVRRVAHVLPEGRPGADLSEDSARALARQALPPGRWEEIGAEETTHESRVDWLFTFRDPSVLGEVAGEGRASVAVRGDEVTDLRRFVQVPEEWERRQREAGSRRNMVTRGLLFGLGLLFVSAAIVAIVVWSRGALDVGALWKAAGLASVTLALSLANDWPATASLFSTAQPFGFQATAAAVGLVLVVLVGAAGIGLVVALAHSWSDPATRVRPPPLLGMAIGAFLAGAAGVASNLAGGPPPLPGYAGAASYVPALAPPLGTVVPFLIATAAASVLAAAHGRFRGHAALRSVTAFAMLALGIVLVPGALQEAVTSWVPAAVLAVALIRGLVHVLEAFPASAPATFATVLALGLVETAIMRPYPGSVLGAVVALVVVAALARSWTRELARAPAG